MKEWDGYAETQEYSNIERLPAGGYVLKITDVHIDEAKNGMMSDVVVLNYDISEGEYKGYFRQNYNSQPENHKKWKGTYRLFVPRNDRTEDDEKTKRRFKTVIKTFESSNPGYVWDWNEKRLIGKEIGALFNNKEYYFNGYHGFFTNCYTFIDAQRVRDGKFTVPKDTLLNKENSNEDFMNLPDDFKELPF